MGSGYRVFTAGEVLTASNVQNYLQDQAVMVFGGTAARSSAIGTANFEEGMLTYLTDVDKLQVYTGAAFADVYPPTASSQGLTLLSTTSFSGVTSQSFNNVFSTTYDYYKVIFNGNTASNSDINLRMRVAGVDNSSAIYNRQFLEANNTTIVGARSNSQTSIQIGGTGANVGDYDNLITLEIGRPFVATQTSFISNVLEVRSGTGTLTRMFTGAHASLTSFDGFTLIAGSNMTASVSVFGYNK
jgi:hypothetical protein